MADLDFVKVIGRLGMTVGDSESDVDENPDVIWCDSGEVTFTPLVTVTKVMDALPVPVSLGHSVLKASVDAEGYISYLGRRSLSLVDLTSAKLNPSVASGKATHKVDFKNIKAGGNAVSFVSFTGRFASDTVDANQVCDLTKLSPLPAAGGAAVVIGPSGKSVTSMRVLGGNLLYTIDGVEASAGPVPGGTGSGFDDAAATTEFLEGVQF